MSATASRTITTAPESRQLGMAVGALVLAVALLAGLAISRQASFQGSAPDVAAPAAAHDHGWSVGVGGPLGGATVDRGEIQYTGIPYTPTRSNPSTGVPREKFAR
jgi:hypothetical protein